jgi:hypothetical protein
MRRTDPVLMRDLRDPVTSAEFTEVLAPCVPGDRATPGHMHNEYTRGCLATQVERRSPGAGTVGTLDELTVIHGTTLRFRIESGAELISTIARI